MAELKTGDGVIITTREVTSEDSKTGLYFLYFGGLNGKVDRIYEDGSVCVDVNIDSLSDESRKRHLAMQEAERKRWLDNLSGEARNRLSDEQKQLKISYKILVSKKDLEPFKPVKPKSISSKETDKSNTTPEGAKEGPAGVPDPAANLRDTEADKQQATRLSEADLEAKEAEFLRSLKEGK